MKRHPALPAWLPDVTCNDVEVKQELLKHIQHCLESLPASLGVAEINEDTRNFINGLAPDSLQIEVKSVLIDNLNPFGVTVGGSDVEDELRQQLENIEHPYFLRMHTEKMTPHSEHPLVDHRSLEVAPFSNAGTATIINSHAHDSRQTLANLLIANYIKSLNRRDYDYETLDTDLEPAWRENDPLSFEDITDKKLAEFHNQICTGQLPAIERPGLGPRPDVPLLLKDQLGITEESN